MNIVDDTVHCFWSELVAELERTSIKYETVEEFPHEPPIDGFYYACPTYKPGNGKALDDLLSRFNPATDIDRDLMLAAFMTPAWGGPFGARPVFLITSDDGRGAGKSTVAEMVGSVWGGYLTFNQNEDINKIKTRLLSTAALTKRIGLLDNVKSAKFSWGELEGMVTSSSIGGHRLFKGEATRPNTLTWFITLNGASMGTDMAQRSVVIKVVRPTRSASWLEDTKAFIEANRKELIADIIGKLQAEKVPLKRFSRWATWEKDILQRLPDPSEAQAVILERQGAIDTDAEESAIIEEFFEHQLQSLNYPTDTACVFVPSQIAGRWFNMATSDNAKVIGVMRQLNQMCKERQLNRIQRCPSRVNGRGLMWIGEEVTKDSKTHYDIEDRIRWQK